MLAWFRGGGDRPAALAVRDPGRAGGRPTAQSIAEPAWLCELKS